MEMYKIGQILTSNKDIEVEKEISGEKVTISKGSQVIIGADKLAHNISNGMVQSIGEATVDGYDTEGIARYLCIVLDSHLPLSEMLADFGIEGYEVQVLLEDALDEIGF